MRERERERERDREGARERKTETEAETEDAATSTNVMLCGEVALADFSQVAMLCVQYKSVNFGA